MIDNSESIFVFDVDGVIVDSTEECLIVAWNAYQAYTDKKDFIVSPEEADDKYAEHFRSIRNYVRSMDEYLLVFHSEPGEIQSQDDFERKAESLPSDEKKRYGDFFFQAREKLKKRDFKAWIRLHQFYPEIGEIVRKIHQKHVVYIVTGKDKESVSDFLKDLNLQIPASHIYDRDAAKNKLAALRQIADIERKRFEETYFIDDNITHLVEPCRAGFKVFLAEWGYGLPEHFQLAKQCQIPVVTIDDLLSLKSVPKRK